jgi:hypothetical protein
LLPTPAATTHALLDLHCWLMRGNCCCLCLVIMVCSAQVAPVTAAIAASAHRNTDSRKRYVNSQLLPCPGAATWPLRCNLLMTV